MQVKKTVVDQIIKEEVVKLSKVIVLNEEKQNILKQLNELYEEVGPFNDAGEPTMTHSQYRDYSEPSEQEFDEPYQYTPEKLEGWSK